MKKIYENKKIRVFWEPEKCIHSTNCLHGLPQVFDTHKRPWVDIDAAGAEEIKRCIDTCPSGALSYEILETDKQ
jgi:uncharacterized Fe-S cluster protein YjdI